MYRCARVDARRVERRARALLRVILEEPQRGGRLRERVSAVREQLPGTRLNLGCRLNLHKFSLHGLQPGVLMSGHLRVSVADITLSSEDL